MNKGKIRDYVAKLFIFFGVTIYIGSIGACENGDYSILQCMACIVCGALMEVIGIKIREESGR